MSATATATDPKVHQGIEAAATGRVTRISQKENVTFLGLACNRPVKNAQGEYEQLTTFVDAKLVGDAHKKTDFSEIRKGTLVKVEGPMDTRTYQYEGKDRQGLDMTVFKPDHITVLGQPKGDQARAAGGVAAATATADGEPPF